jgi:hypothetical protein
VRASELLAVLAEQRSLAAEADCAGDLAMVLHALGRGVELVQLAARVTTSTPWLQAATAVATGDFERAAGIYAQIGSRPHEAFARLCAAESLLADGRRVEGNAQLQRALTFYRKAGAIAHIRHGEGLLAASA